MAAIMHSLWKLADKMGLGIHKDTIEEQINAMNKALEQKQENNIANALWNYADASGGGGGSGSGFNLFLDKNKNVMYINNSSDSVDLRDIMDEYGYGWPTLIMNPVSEIKLTTLSSSTNYDISFVPKSGCKYYEDDTELNPNDMFVPVVYPGGQTSYNPNGVYLYRLRSSWSPYDTPHETRKLTSNDSPMDDIIIE